MAIFHCQIKIVSRSDGRSAVAAAAYRAGVRLECEREGRTHDYCARTGVENSFIVAPDDAPAWVMERENLWNNVEAAEIRSNARVAREWEVALPNELSNKERQELVLEYAQALTERYSIVIDAAIHAPASEGDHRNHHAHLMATTRKITREGFTEKTRILDDRKTGPLEIERTRAMWAEIQNRALERSGSLERVDHRSLEDQRIAAQERGDVQKAAQLDRAPETHLGATVSAIERNEMRRAARQGREYKPVTERGQYVYEVREAKRNLFQQLNAVRERYNDAREQGKSILDALRESMKRDHEQKKGLREANSPTKSERNPVQVENEKDGLSPLKAMREKRERDDHARDKPERDRNLNDNRDR